MGEKKKKEVAQKKWKKVLFVILAVLFVVVMVVSSMGSNWITGLAPVKAGEPVVVDYTVYDAAGNPVLTSNQQLYEKTLSGGKAVLYTRNLTVTANQSLKTAIYPIQVYVASGGGSWEQFALYNPEYNAISSGVVGMRAGDKKTVPFNYSSSMSTLFSPDDLQRANLNTSAVEVGDPLVMGVSESPNATASNTSVTYIRLGEVTRKSSNGIVVDFGYPYAEITVLSFTKQ